MRASSPALALVQRPIAVPRPRPRAVPADPSPASTDSPAAADAARDAEAVVRPSDVAPRPTLRSVDLEYLADAEPPRRSTLPPPLPERARQRRRELASRLSHPEIADTVLAALRDLSFFETPVEAMSFGLVTALRALPSLAGLALLRDDEQGGYAVVYARGPRSAAVVRARVAEDDPFVGLALVRGGPVCIEYGSDTPPPDRHSGFGDPWSSLVAPVQVGDRCVGILELVDPLDGRTLGASARTALDTVARHLALFLQDKPTHVAGAFAPEQVGLEE